MLLHSEFTFLCLFEFFFFFFSFLLSVLTLIWLFCHHPSIPLPTLYLFSSSCGLWSSYSIMMRIQNDPVLFCTFFFFPLHLAASPSLISCSFSSVLLPVFLCIQFSILHLSWSCLEQQVGPSDNLYHSVHWKVSFKLQSPPPLLLIIIILSGNTHIFMSLSGGPIKRHNPPNL